MDKQKTQPSHYHTCNSIDTHLSRIVDFLTDGETDYAWARRVLGVGREVSCSGGRVNLWVHPRATGEGLSKKAKVVRVKTGGI